MSVRDKMIPFIFVKVKSVESAYEDFFNGFKK